MKLSHALLKTVYSTDTCISCTVVDENNDNQNNNQNNNDQNQNEILDMCDNLYADAAKCEKAHGFDNGYSGYSAYANQLAQEELVCDFIKSVDAGTYDEEGEIAIKGANRNSSGGSATTGGQKFALTFFILGTVALAVYAAMLHNKLTKGGKSGLSTQGGAMA
jgi:hypothetical protein